MDRRRYRRYAIELPLELGLGRQTLRVLSADVSFQGLFVRMDAPPRLRQLVRVALELPGTGTTFQSHAMCVFRIEAGAADGRPPGAGCKLYATAEDQRRHWHAFVERLRVLSDDDDAHPEVPQAEPQEAVELLLDLEIVERRTASVGELLLLEKELAQGVVTLAADHEIAVGTSLRAHLVHPETGGVFGLDGVARLSSPGAGGGELLLEWSDPSEERLEEFRRFVYLGFTDIELEDVARVSLEAPR